MLYSQAVEFTRRFYEWELRGRGWARYPYPVPLEPPFRPFVSHHAPTAVDLDDGRHHTRLSGFFERLQGATQAPKELPAALPEPEPEPEADLRRGQSELAEFVVALPEGTRVARGALLGFLRALSSVGQRTAFEVVGGEGRVEVRFALAREDAPHALAQLRAALPTAMVTTAREPLRQKWERSDGRGFAAGLESGELGLYQVLFEETREPWAPSILRSVVTHTGEVFFADAPEVTALAKEKVASPLYAVAAGGSSGRPRDRGRRHRAPPRRRPGAVRQSSD
jgi:hypothetical protein